MLTFLDPKMTNKTEKGITMVFQSRGIFLILILVCFFVCTFTSKVFTAPETSDLNIQKGKMYFKAENYQKSLRYLLEAIRLDPRNQQAHSLAGVAYTKLGKWTDARREFEIVVRLNPNSAEAKQAQKWLKRLQEPIPVFILPFVDLSNASSRYGSYKGEGWSSVIAGAYIISLSKYLTNSGLYKLLPVKMGALIDINVLHSNFQSICQEAKNQGAKIIVSGFIDEYDRQITGPIYKDLQKVTIKVYSTKDCRLIHSVTDSQRVFMDTRIDTKGKTIQDNLKLLFDRIFKEINAKLI